MIKSNGSASGVLVRVVFAPDQISNATRSRLHELRFQSGTQSLSPVYVQSEWNFVPERESRIENRHERIPELLVQEVSVVLVKIRRWNELVPEWKSFRYHVNSPLKNSLTMEHCHVRKYWTHSPHIPPTNSLSRDVIDGQIFKIFHDTWKRDERQSQSSNSRSFSTFTRL